jgi:hypothetical protein
VKVEWDLQLTNGTGWDGHFWIDASEHGISNKALRHIFEVGCNTALANMQGLPIESIKSLSLVFSNKALDTVIEV